ncbi:MAG: GTP 3',8-cyclase MoaA [Terriglobales bacterium]
MSTAPAMAVVILTGGASRRMGQDKSTLDWHGRPLLGHLIQTAREAGAAEVAVAGPRAPAGVERLDDAVAGHGPLGGILAALRWRPRVLVIACDMPRLTPALLRHLWEQAAGFDGWTVAADQPLCAVYSRALLPHLEAAAGDEVARSLSSILALAPRQDLGSAQLRAAGFPEELFANLNTPTDYRAAHEGELHDSFGRVIRDLRISLTDRCNYRCVYCRFGTGEEHAEHPLSWPELERLAAIFHRLGIAKYRLTGGEPLLRSGITEYVRFLSELGAQDIALTTNGHLLAPRAAELARAGLRRVTISLDSLDTQKFARITRVANGLEHVLAAITAAQAAGLTPIKVNVVLLRGYNDDEIESLAAFARERDLVLRFIEFMPLETGSLWKPELVVPMEEVLERIGKVYPLEPLPLRVAETARRFRFRDGAPGQIGIVAPVTSPFCNQCSRIRLTADGKLRTCLFSLREWDLRAALAESDAAAEQLLCRAVYLKEERHHIGEQNFTKPARGMVQIGG